MGSGDGAGPAIGTPLERARALREVLVSALERLKPPDAPAGLEAPAALQYHILREEYLQGLQNKQIMARHSISERTFHRNRRQSIWALAIELQNQEDLLIPTTSAVPSQNGAAIVMAHGHGSNRSGDLPLSRDLAGLGYGLMIPDLRAHGDSEGSASTVGLLEVPDMRAADDYVKQRPDVDPSRIGVLGTSLGSAVAIMSASEISELKAVVATSGFSSWATRKSCGSCPVCLIPGVGWPLRIKPRGLHWARRIFLRSGPSSNSRRYR